jgi:hypothetical protein
MVQRLLLGEPVYPEIEGCGDLPRMIESRLAPLFIMAMAMYGTFIDPHEELNVRSLDDDAIQLEHFPGEHLESFSLPWSAVVSEDAFFDFMLADSQLPENQKLTRWRTDWYGRERIESQLKNGWPKLWTGDESRLQRCLKILARQGL